MLFLCCDELLNLSEASQTVYSYAGGPVTSPHYPLLKGKVRYRHIWIRDIDLKQRSDYCNPDGGI